jgi:hypothetical protein
MGSAKRSELVSKDQKNLPGPGGYDHNSKTIGKDVISVRLKMF